MKAIRIVGLIVALGCSWKLLRWFWLKPKRLERRPREEGLEEIPYTLLIDNAIRRLREQGLPETPYTLLIEDAIRMVNLQNEAKSKSINISDDIVNKYGMETAFQLDNNWVQIDGDLLDEIGLRIDSYADYIRFRSTNKDRYSRLPRFSKYIEFPLLMLPFEYGGETFRALYHPEERKVVCCLPLPETKNTAIHGSCYGWLILIGLDDTIQIMNPFTRAQIQLPPLSTLPKINYQPNRHGKEYEFKITPVEPPGTFGKKYMQNVFVKKVILSNPPDDDDQDFIAVALYSWRHHLCFCRRGDKVWTNIVETINFRRRQLQDAIFHKEKLYAVDAGGLIFECEIKSSKRELVLSREPSCDDDILLGFKYLVQSSRGDLLLVTRFVRFSGGIYGTLDFNTYKLDESQDKWIEVKSLDDDVLVVGYNSSVSVLPHRFSRNKRNCIYYSDDGIFDGGHDNGVFHLEDRSIHQLFPGFSPIWPNPIWLCNF